MSDGCDKQGYHTAQGALPEGEWPTISLRILLDKEGSCWLSDAGCGCCCTDGEFWRLDYRDGLLSCIETLEGVIAELHGMLDRLRALAGLDTEPGGEDA